MKSGMRAKNINQAIKSKMDKWLVSLPEDLRDKIKKNIVVTGGCIASMLLGEEVNDYDVYLKTEGSTLLLAQHYVDEFQKSHVDVDITLQTDLKDSIGRKRIRIDVKSNGEAREEQLGDNPYRPIYLTSNAITLSGSIQVIIRFWGGPEAIHENFDFVHCMNYWTYEEGVVLNPEALEALLSKTLLYRGSLYPICSIIRSKKFIERGWKINAGQYLKMALQISKLNLADHDILEEQLTGVDTAFFAQVLRMARDKDNASLIESSYLVTIIDRMF